MAKITKRIAAMLLALSMTIALCSCQSTDKDSDKDQDKDTSSDTAKDDDKDADKDDDADADADADADDDEIDRSEFLELEVFSASANYAGTMGGWYGEWIKEKFNVELTVIAPNIAGEAIYQTRAASGNLGDILMLDGNDFLDCYNTGMLYNLTDYYDDSKYLKNYDLSVKRVSKFLGTEDVYGVNNICAAVPADTPWFVDNSVYIGNYMRIDYYDEMGRPEMKDWHEMLDVLKEMQDAHPVSETSGGKVYGFTLFPSWDGTYMALAGKFGSMYGCAEGAGMLFTNADGTEYQDIAQDDGTYHLGLEILFEANQMGLVDPESTTQDWSAVSTKTGDGEVLYAFWAFQTGVFNTLERRENGQMLGYIPVGDQELVTVGLNPYGESRTWGIGSQTKDIERTFEVFDWLGSSEYMYSTSGSGAGVEGITFEIVDGEPALTELGVAIRANPDYELPEDIYGGGKYRCVDDGFNGGIGHNACIDPATGLSHDVTTWPSYLESNKTAASELYSDMIGGYQTCGEYLIDNDLLSVIPGTSYTAPIEDTLLATMRSDCGEIIKQYSWQMVFAKDRAEFDALWATMKTEIDGFGYQDVVDYDIAELANISAARLEALAE